MAGKGRNPGSNTETYKAILKKIAEHGSTVIEEPEVEIHGHAMRAERILIALEVVYQKGVKDKNLGALMYYLDRLLGKPKESLNLTNGADLIGKLTDQQLIERIDGLIETVRERGAGKSAGGD